MGRPIIADATGQGGNPARDASRLPKDFPNGLRQLATAPADKRGAVARYAAPAIIATLAISAAMNGFAFEAHAEGLLIYPAAALGLAIPALIYALMNVAATLWIGHEPQRLRGI